MRGEGRGARGERSFAALLALFVLALHATALRGWWLYDDPQLVLEARRQSLVDLFFNPAEYVHLAAHTFVPLQLVSYKIDLALGATPFVFYLHQLLSLTAAVVLLFFVLRQHVDQLYALAGAALFAGSWAATYAARTLMIRHYVDGLALALLALLLWRRRPIVASFVYLLAMLAKEVYAPVILLFVAMTPREQRRPRTFIAPIAAAAIWFVWRWYMTRLVGGYATFPDAQQLLKLPAILVQHLVGPAPIAILALWCVVALALLVRRPRAVLLLFVAGIAPVLPLAASFEWRYSFSFVACAIAALTLAAGRHIQRWPLIALTLLAVIATVMSFPQRGAYAAQTAVVEAEGQYVATRPPTAPVLLATSPEWYLGGLAELRNAPSPRFICSTFAVACGDVDASHVVTIDGAHPAVEPRRFADAPLDVTFALAHNDASWQLGPPGGEFTFLTHPAYTAIPIPPQGTRRVPAARAKQWFRIARRAADGSWTISPVLPVPGEGETTRWKRP